MAYQGNAILHYYFKIYDLPVHIWLAAANNITRTYL